MMFKTRVTERLGIRYPIIGGTMMWLSTPEFVAAIANAGALGIICSAMWKTREQFRDALRRVKDLTDQPLAVNLNLFPAMRPIDNNDYLEVLIDEGIRIVETSGHRAPEELVSRFKEAGLTWIHKCVGLRYAQKAVSLGADMVTVVGYENGGATGVLDIGTFVLVNRVAEALEVPVIGGGGVATGRGLLAILALGAEAAIIGTLFLLSEECPIHPNLKKALAEAEVTDTVLVMRSVGNTHRVWRNERAEAIMALEERKASLEEIIAAAAGEKDRMMFESGDVSRGTISVGQGIGLCREVKPCGEIVAEIMAEAETALRQMARWNA